MKHNFKVSVFCLLLLVSFLLTSCELSIPKLTFGTTGKTENTTGNATPEQPDEEGDPTPPDKLALAKNGKTDYTIIFPMGAAQWKRDLILWFRSTFYELTGAELAIRDDFEAEDEPETLRTEREIVIGAGSTREDCYSYDDALYSKGYSNFVAGERVVLLSGSQAGMYLGICQFFKDLFGVDVSKGVLPTETVDCLADLSYAATEYLSNPAFYYMEQDITAEENR